MNKEKKLIYIGKGFLGYDEADREMIYISDESKFSILVEYKGKRMLVDKWNVKEI